VTEHTCELTSRTGDDVWGDSATKKVVPRNGASWACDFHYGQAAENPEFET